MNNFDLETGDWISCKMKLPPIWKYVEFYDPVYKERFVAKRCLWGRLKYFSGIVDNFLDSTLFWRFFVDIDDCNYNLNLDTNLDAKHKFHMHEGDF
jgi:hypothetical protein